MDTMFGGYISGAERLRRETKTSRERAEMDRDAWAAYKVQADKIMKYHKDLHDSISKSRDKPVSPRIPRTLHNDR